MRIITEGDTVKHKKSQINNDLPMTVLATYGHKVSCECFEDNRIKSKWFHIEELELIRKGQEVLGMRVMPQ